MRPCSASTCATTGPRRRLRPRPGLTYPSIFDPPGRSLAQLGGVPRNVVPLTVVLDRQHRVAAVYLRSVRVSELVPLVQRLAAEPPAP